MKSGHAAKIYIDQAVRHVHLKQGVLGIKVKIQSPHDPTGVDGVKTMLPDTYQVRDFGGRGVSVWYVSSAKKSCWAC